MSTIVSDALAQALSAVSSYKGETLQYRTTHAGTLTALPTGFVLHRDRVPAPIFVGDRQAEAQTAEGYLKGPLSPAMVVGYEIVDGNGNGWAIYSVAVDNQQICRVRSTTTLALAPDRGHTR